MSPKRSARSSVISPSMSARGTRLTRLSRKIAYGLHFRKCAIQPRGKQMSSRFSQLPSISFLAPARSLCVLHHPAWHTSSLTEGFALRSVSCCDLAFAKGHDGLDRVCWPLTQQPYVLPPPPPPPRPTSPTSILPACPTGIVAPATAPHLCMRVPQDLHDCLTQLLECCILPTRKLRLLDTSGCVAQLSVCHNLTVKLQSQRLHECEIAQCPNMLSNARGAQFS